MVTHFSLMSHQDHSLAIKRVNGLAFMHHFSSLMDHSKWFKSTLACTVEELGLKHLINGGLGLPPEEQLFKVTCPQRYTGQKKSGEEFLHFESTGWANNEIFLFFLSF